jgi:hypothetical protein
VCEELNVGVHVAMLGRRSVEVPHRRPGVLVAAAADHRQAGAAGADGEVEEGEGCAHGVNSLGGAVSALVLLFSSPMAEAYPLVCGEQGFTPKAKIIQSARKDSPPPSLRPPWRLTAASGQAARRRRVMSPIRDR